MGQTALGDADSASLQQEIVDLRAELARKEEEIAQLISRLQVLYSQRKMKPNGGEPSGFTVSFVLFFNHLFPTIPPLSWMSFEFLLFLIIFQ